MKADDILAAAREAIGTPFVHQGRVVGVGLDCAGLAIHVARRLGVDHVDVAGYERVPSGGRLEAVLDDQPGIAVQVVRDEPQAGDLLLMRFASEPQHLAICAGKTIIHAYAQVGRVCEHRFADVWRARVVRVYRFAEMS